MRRPRAIGVLAVLLFAGVSAPLVRSQAVSAPGGVAYLAIDLSSGKTLNAERVDQLDRPVLPGSIAKIFTLAAALESGTIGPRSGLSCAHQVTVAGHQLVCTHPDVGRPLLPAEALAHSCNTYFTTIASRVPRSAFERVLSDLGMPSLDRGAPLPAAAVGVEGLRVAPRRLVAALAMIAAEPSPLPWRTETLTVLREGLRGAAVYGSARALGDKGVVALAKTGTVISNGVAQGLVVGVEPASSPRAGFVVLASGAAGLDAATIAADRLTPAALASQIRLGHTQQDGTYRVSTLPMDDYVAGVVAGEAAVGSSAAALEALAITVRTYADANRSRHGPEGFDLCDLTHCQVHRRPTLATTRATQATRGLVLLDKGAVARVFYTASCGGHTERPSQVWRGAPDPAYLPDHADAACEGAPRWSSELTARDLLRALVAGGYRGDTLRGVSVRSRTASGRVAWLQLDGVAPDQISGDDFRTLVGRVLGWQYLRSTAFAVTRIGAGYRFDGHGAGHGVGLCVVGSANLAKAGATRASILAQYFPGLTVGVLPATPSGVAARRMRIVLPPSAQQEDAAIRALAGRLLDARVRALGVSAPDEVVLRFHPTVENYQRETQRPWFTAASTSGRQIDLLPLDVLQQRGILESILNHELVHVLTVPSLGNRPLWVLEGVAAYHAGEHRDAALTSCPSDSLLRQPSSAEALRRAMAAAGACVAAQIRAGRDWRDVR